MNYDELCTIDEHLVRLAEILTGHKDTMRQAAKHAGMRTRVKTPARSKRKFAGFKTSTTVPAKQKRKRARKASSKRHAAAKKADPFGSVRPKGHRYGRRKKHSRIG